MPTLLYLDQTFDCTTAIKGADYIHLLDENGCMVASFDGISDFSGFTLQNGNYTSPTADHDCYLAVIRDDGTIAKGGHKCSGVATTGHTHTADDVGAYTKAAVDSRLSGKSDSDHKHGAGDITSGILPVVRGGTGADTPDGALVNLGACRIEMGTYTGTGVYGSATPNSITLKFVPKLIFIFGANMGPLTGFRASDSENVKSNTIIAAYPAETSGVIGYDNGYPGLCDVRFTWGTTFSWYVTDDSSRKCASAQCNTSGETYYYVAFG